MGVPGYIHSRSPSLGRDLPASWAACAERVSGAKVADRNSDLPPGWARPTVAEVGAVRLGRQRSPDKQTGRFSTKYLRAANIGPHGLELADLLEMDFTPAERRAFSLRVGDVVLAEASGSAAQVGRAALWSGEVPGCCYQNTVIRFRGHATLPEYALVVFRHHAATGLFANAARGVGILHLGAGRLAELPFPLPPLAEQKRIAAAVATRQGELQHAEASLRSALTRIDEQSRQILAAAVSGGLVETEASIAAREGRDFERALHSLGPLEDGSDGSGQAMLFDGPRSETEPTPATALPEGWAWVRVDAVGEVQLGKKREPTAHHGDDMRPYLRVANVHEDRLDLRDVKEMNFTADEQGTYALQPGDILLNEGQSPELVGRPAMYRGELPGVCFQMTLLRFRAGPAVLPDYALLVFRHFLHAGVFRAASRWSTNIAHLSRQRLAAIPFPLPPLTEQARIVDEAKRRLEASDAQKAAVQASLGRLPKLRTELLTVALAGALVAQDADDEPAAVLLERAGPPPSDLSGEAAMGANVDEEHAAGSPPEEASEAAARLVDVLRAAGKPLRLPDLCHAAGYDRHQTEDIERFYVALSPELGRTIRRVGTDAENAELEIIPDAAR